MENTNKNPFSSSSFFSDSPVKTIGKKIEQKTDPFVTLIETGTYTEILKLASNPNISKEAVEKIIEKFPLGDQEHWELRDKLASNANLPKDEKILEQMRQDAYGYEEDLKYISGSNKDVRTFDDVKTDAYLRRSDILLDARQAAMRKDYSGENVSATASEEELQIILKDPNLHKDDKKDLEQRIKQARAEKAKIDKEKRLDREASQELFNSYDKERQNKLKNAKKGIFDENDISEAISGITGGWTRLKSDKKPDKDQDYFSKEWDKNYEKTIKNRQDILSIKEKNDIKQAKKGVFSNKDLDLARELVGNTIKTEVESGIQKNIINSGVLNVSDKDLNIDQRRTKQYSQQLISLKREDELKRARKGDFSGITIQEPNMRNSPVVKGDDKHYQALKALKKTDELKRARKGDFSTVKMPEDMSTLSKTDKKHYEEITRLKKTDELKRARKGDFSTVKMPEDMSTLSKTDKKHYEEITRLKKQKEEKDKREQKRKEKEQKQNKNFFSDEESPVKSISEPSTLKEGEQSFNDVRNAARSGNSEISKQWMSNMEKMQNKVKEQDLSIRNNASLNPESKDMAKSSVDYNLEIAKKQATFNPPNISKDTDSITSLYNDMKHGPDFRKLVT